MSFTNTQVDLESLPAFDEVELHPVDPRHPKIVLGLVLAFELGAFIVIAGVFGSGTEARAALTTAPGVTALAGAAVIATWIAWYSHKAASVIRFAVREHDVILHSGVFFKREVIQPIRRIQHAEQTQGPVARRFGLAKLRLFSAGTAHFAFEIPGLDAATAARMRQSILSLRESKLARSRPADADGDGDAGAAGRRGAAPGAAGEPARTDD